MSPPPRPPLIAHVPVALSDDPAFVRAAAQGALDFFRTLGPNETLFVDGQGRSLDGQITFDSAEIEVVPEPEILNLVLVGSCCWMWRPRLQHRVSV